MIIPIAPMTPVAARQKITIETYLTNSSRVRSTGTVSRYRSVPRLASPESVSPATTATASGRNSGSSADSAVNARNTPLPVTWAMNGGPSPGRGRDAWIATPISTGARASTSSSAWVRRRPNTSRSSEPRRRRVGYPTVTGAAVAVAVAVSVDIEAFPGEGHVTVFQAGALDAEAEHR